MKNIKIFLGTAVISVLFMQFGAGEYVRKTAPDENKDQPKFTPRPTKPLPIPQKKQASQAAEASTASQQRQRPVPPPKPANLSATPSQPTRKPLPVAPNPFDTPLTGKDREAIEKDTDNPFANVPRTTTIVAEKQAPSNPRQVVDTNMDLTKSSAAELKQIREKAMAEFNAIDAKEPEARTPAEDKRYGELGAFFQRMGEEIAKKEKATETGTVAQWQRATPAGIEEKKKADEQAAKAAEQAAKFKEVADRLQPRQLTIWEKIKQGATAVKETFLGRKPTVEISAPTNFRKLSTEEAAAKAQADINAAKAQAVNTAAQEKERTAIQKLGTKIIDQINIFTAKISGPRAPSSAEATSIKGAINGFVDSVRNKFATATEPMRKTMSTQLDAITRNINQAIAKIPVNSPQRRQMLSSKFALNHLSFNTAKANLDSAKTTAEKLAAAAEYSRALEQMLNSPESRRIGLAEIEAAIKKNNDILSRSPDAITETNVARVTKELQKQRESILAIEASKKEHDALTREFIEGAKKEAATLTGKEKEVLLNAVKRAEESLKPPATRLKEAQEAIKKSNKAIGGAAKAFKTTIQSAFKNLEKTLAVAPKKVQAAATKLNRDLSAKITKIGSSVGKSLDTAISDFDTFIKKPLVKELSSANKEIQKGINRIITEARKFIGIAQTQNEQRKAAEAARKKASEDADYVRQSQEAAKRIAAEKEASILAAEATIGVKRSATRAEIAKAFRLAAIKASKIQDPIARQAAIAEITKAKGILENKQADLYSGAGSATGTESDTNKRPQHSEATTTQANPKPEDVD